MCGNSARADILRTTARSLINSTTVEIQQAEPGNNRTDDAKRIPDANPFKGAFEVVSNPFLNSQSLTNSSSVGWYLLAASSDYSYIEIAFLDGMPNPTFNQAEADFNTLEIQMRAY